MNRKTAATLLIVFGLVMMLSIATEANSDLQQQENQQKQQQLKENADPRLSKRAITEWRFKRQPAARVHHQSNDGNMSEQELRELADLFEVVVELKPKQQYIGNRFR